jgi:FkbM family methyltransferase
MSKTLARAIVGVGRLLTAVQNPRRRVSTLARAGHMLEQHVTVPTTRGALTFLCATARAVHDPQGFGTDEPETLAWIEEFLSEGTLWDIGANIGLYALYAALDPKTRVVAIEPGAATFGALMRNVELNGLGDRIQAFCLALDEAPHVASLHMAHTEAGHSMHAFGAPVTVMGPVQAVFSQATLGLSVDVLAGIAGVWPPDHIKLDVDSIEAKILRGARQTLSRVRSVIVEVMGPGEGADGPMAVLEDCGFAELPRYRAMGGRNRVFVNRALCPDLL